MLHKLFVYGTLKRGGKLHHYLSPQIHKNSRFIGDDQISNCNLFMIQWYPGVKEGDDCVTGEVYEIDESMLAIMDELEGEGTLYKRMMKTTLSGVDVWIYMYLGNVNPSCRISSGSFDVTKAS